MPAGIKDKVAVIGMGCSKFGERWDCGPDELMVEAYVEALQDAGIEPSQLDAAWFSTHIDEIGTGKGGTPLSVALRLPNIAVTRVENFCASGSEAFRGAVYAVAAGAADIALAVGVEKLKDTGYGGLPVGAPGTLIPQISPNGSPAPIGPSTGSPGRTSSAPSPTFRSRATPTAPRTPRPTCASRSPRSRP